MKTARKPAKTYGFELRSIKQDHLVDGANHFLPTGESVPTKMVVTRNLGWGVVGPELSTTSSARMRAIANFLNSAADWLDNRGFDLKIGSLDKKRKSR